MKRILAIDTVRGSVMVIMALDHVRDLIHVDSITESPTNLQTTTAFLFFTRWITHLCAPTFVFLAGTSVYLSYKNSEELSRTFLLKRGLYLLVLEFVVVNFALFFDIGYHTLLFEVIAAIGCGFLVLALLMNTAWQMVGIIGLLILFGHNQLPLAPAPDNSTLQNFLSFLFRPGAVPLAANRVLVIGYPPIPWIGIMMVGFAAGKFFEWQEVERKKIWIRTGIIALLLFVVLRFVNVYGEGLPWSSQETLLLSFLSFMNVSKYPPSLLFCLVTLGVMFLLLAVFEGRNNRMSRLLSVYGKVPLFYFLLHFFLIHGILLIILFLQGFSGPELEFASGTFGRPKDLQSGLPLGAVFLIWIGVVVLLYWPCRWFGQYKSTHRQWWLKYM